MPRSNPFRTEKTPVSFPLDEAKIYTFSVGPSDEGRRLDLFLAEHPATPDWSRSQIQRLIREDNVRVEGPGGRRSRTGKPSLNIRIPKPGMLLRPGDRIYVTQPTPEPSEAVPEDIPLDLVYEDADLVVVNKPPGLVVHPAPGHVRGTLVNALLARLPDLKGIGGKMRPGIVHRLDKDTSGLMMVAKTEQTLKRLQSTLQSRRIRREYLALAWGNFPDTGRIEGNIGRHPLHRKKMAVVENGKPAVTWFRVVERFGQHALVELRLETGRTHQIRVHLSHQRTPIIGDPVYGVRHKGDPPMERQALHAFRLAFDHPITGEAMRVEAPLPDDMQEALAFLRREKA